MVMMNKKEFVSYGLLELRSRSVFRILSSIYGGTALERFCQNK